MRRDYTIFPGDLARLERAARTRDMAEAIGDATNDLRECHWLYHEEAVALQSTDSAPIAAFCKARIQEIQVLQDGIKAQLKERGEFLHG